MGYSWQRMGGGCLLRLRLPLRLALGLLPLRRLVRVPQPQLAQKGAWRWWRQRRSGVWWGRLSWQR